MDVPQVHEDKKVVVAEEKKAAKKAAKPKVKAPIQSSGKRKRAIARAVLTPGKGIIRINNSLLEHLTPIIARHRIMEPLMLSEEVGQKVNINVQVQGGGWQGQADAVRLAIGRALAQFDKKLKKVFLTYDRHIMIADVRRREQRKPNDSKARAARQKSYR